MEDVIYKKYVFGYKYPIMNTDKDNEHLKQFISAKYGFCIENINIETFIHGLSRRPFYLDQNNHYIVFEVKSNVFLSIDGNLKLLNKEG